MVDFLIVGAGFAGSVLARKLAEDCHATCLVVDRREHIAGNAFDSTDSHGVLLHRYGPHYFRTNSSRVVEFLSRFTTWHPVEYRIQSCVEGKLWPFPINLNTFEMLLGRASSSAEMEATLAQWRVPITSPANSEEVIVSQVGWKLYEMFYRNYTRKQWAREPRELDPSVCGRIPIRTNRDDRYLTESFQALPADGYTAMFANMLDHPRIEVRLGTAYEDVRRGVGCRHLIYTGSLDAYFDFCHGPLAYRSLRFEAETHFQEFVQPVVQVNFPNDHAYTRTVEIKHATGQKLPVTTVMKEYPIEAGTEAEPYYPVPAPDTRLVFSKYQTLAECERDVTFLGRLANYRYYNMDQIVALALTTFEKLRVRFGNCG